MKAADEFRQTVALSLVEDLGPIRFKSLMGAFGCLDGIYKASEKELMAVQGISAARAKAIKDDTLFDKAEIEIKKARDGGAEIISVFDARYPAELKEIYAPPIVLFVKGRLPEKAVPKMAIVGSRTASLYGLRMARSIGHELAEAGVAVVSGMALGIDSAAHEGALEAGGCTLAVLGGGLNYLYPPQNVKLAREIVKKGAVISEYPMDMTPRAEYFPVRNRIISGLSRAVLVVEAHKKSGALITADAALEEGREVFAVPGNADSAKSAGSNALLKQGAKLVTSAADILEDLKMQGTLRQKNHSLKPEEETLVSLLEAEALHVDQLIEQSGLSPKEAISTLSVMEIKGVVRQLPGKRFERI